MMTQTSTSSTAKLTTNFALVLLILLPLSALGTRFGLWPYTTGLVLLTISMTGSLLVQIVCALWLMCKPTLDTKKALRRASLYALPPLAIVATVLQNSTSGIVLHDVSTDTDNPPVFVELLQERGTDSNSTLYSPEKANKQQQLHPQLESINNNLSQQQNFKLALDTAQDMGLRIVASDAENGRIEAVDTTFWFGFKDDLVIRCQAQQLDIRSTSRVGESNLGANAKRIELFIKQFSENQRQWLDQK